MQTELPYVTGKMKRKLELKKLVVFSILAKISIQLTNQFDELHASRGNRLASNLYCIQAWEVKLVQV